MNDLTHVLTKIFHFAHDMEQEIYYRVLKMADCLSNSCNCILYLNIATIVRAIVLKKII